MRYLSVFILMFILSCSSTKGKKVLFLGDSITYAGDYITYIATYYKLKHPGKQIEFINMGLPSETISGLSEPGHADNRFPRPALQQRLESVLNLINPDVVYACYGMNDGIYMPLDNSRFDSFKQGAEWLDKSLKERELPLIWITPPVYDEKRANAKGYSKVLDEYGNWLLHQRTAQQWHVADVHFPMKNYLENKRKTDTGFYLAKDGVHPGTEGHWLIAKTLLLNMGEQLSDISSFEEIIRSSSEGINLYNLVDRQQQLLKDARLTKAGHQRPEMEPGFPLEIALKKADSIEQVIMSNRLNH